MAVRADDRQVLDCGVKRAGERTDAGLGGKQQIGVDDGIHATTTAYPGLPDSIELIGTQGTARIEGTKLFAAFHDGVQLEHDDGALGGGAGAEPMAFPHHHHRAVLEDFLDAIETDDPARQPKVSGREALKVHRLIEALLRAAESGKREAICAPV